MLPPWGNVAAGRNGTPCFVSGTVRDKHGRPVAGAVIDVWQTEGVEGVYDVQPGSGSMYCRGKITTDAQGRCAFRTVQPVSYPIPDDGPVGGMLRRMGRHPWRPAHIHTMIARDGYRTLTTHIFVKVDAYLASDAVFGVKDSLVADFRQPPHGPAPDGGRSEEPFSTAEYDFVLAAA